MYRVTTSDGMPGLRPGPPTIHLAPSLWSASLSGSSLSVVRRAGMEPPPVLLPPLKMTETRSQTTAATAPSAMS